MSTDDPCRDRSGADCGSTCADGGHEPRAQGRRPEAQLDLLASFPQEAERGCAHQRQLEPHIEIERSVHAVAESLSRHPEHGIERVLLAIVEEGRRLTGAQYAALGLLELALAETFYEAIRADLEQR